MTDEYPQASKPVLATGLLIALLISTAFIPASWIGIKPVTKKSNAVDFNNLDINKYAKDLNNDGEISWKEVITSTKYGSSSIEDLKNNQPSPEDIKTLNDPNNITSSFSKNLLLTSTYLTNNNITDPDMQKKVLDNLVIEESKKIVSKKYVYGNIRVAKDENKESIQKYGNDMAVILQKLITKQTMTDDFQGMEFFIQTEHKEYLDPLATDSARMDTIVQKLLSISVPPSASAYHLIVLNQIVVYRDMLSNMSQASTDPMRATIAFKNYEDTLISTILVYKKLSDYFNLKNIVFSPKDPGYVFTVGYTLQ